MKKLLAKMDLWLLLITIIYLILGSIMIYSASSILTFLKQDVPSNYYFVRQVVILLISFVGSILIIKIPTSKYRYLAKFMMIGVLAALGGLYISGTIANGTKGWYDLGFFNLQPAEFAKTIEIIYLAVTYNKLIAVKEKNYWKYLLPLIYCGICSLLVFLQPDLGTAVVIGGIAIMIFVATPINKKSKMECYKIMGICCLIIGSLGLVFHDKIFNEYQLNRLKFQNPCSRDKEVTGYQVCNGYIAIKNGGIFGLGFGNSTQKYLYLPEAHTDFIFPIIVEELGLITGIVLIIGYLFILYRILLIAKKAKNIRNSILAYGTFAYLLLHMLINLMGVLALIPLTGVPLPFFSYGGSFTINEVILLSICQRVAIETNETKIKEKIKNI